MKIKGYLKGFVSALVCLAILVGGSALLTQAATKNYPEVITGIQVIPITFSNTTSTVTPVTFRMPFKAQLLGVSCHARTLDLTDTDETYTMDVREAGFSVMTSAIAMTAAGTVYEGVITDPYIADEATVSVVVTVGGTTPRLNDLTGLLTIRRTN